MTLAALLEELEEVDAEQSEKLQCWIGRTRQFMNLEVPLECDLAQALIQGSIQRACERRGWEIEQNYRTRGRDGDLPKNMRHYAVVTSWDNDVHTYRGMGNSATKALLAAYIAAVKGEKNDLKG